MLQIVRKKLSADEIQPPGTRYDADCDCIQQTPDGGATWIDAPGLDPRSAPGFRLPATAVTDPQCNAAANMVAKLRTFVNYDLANATIAGLASALLAGILLFVPGVGIIVDAILIAVDVILDIGGGAIAAAFTETVYDDFLCVFYNNIDGDGQMSDDQLADIYAQVAVQFDAVVQAVFGAHSSTLGAVGWSNAGVRGESEDADCSGCAVHCFTVDLTLTDGSEYGIAPLFDTDTWVSGQGWAGHSYSGDHENDATLLWTLPATLNLTGMSAMVYREAGSGANSGTTLRALQPIVNYANDLVGNVFSDENGTSPDYLVFVQTPLAVDVDGISIDCNSGDESTVVYVTRMSITYTGDEAFGGDNC